MTIQHLPADSAKEKISEIIDRDGAYSLGFIDGGRDPIAAIRPELEKSDSGIDYDDIVADLDLQVE